MKRMMMERVATEKDVRVALPLPVSSSETSGADEIPSRTKDALSSQKNMKIYTQSYFLYFPKKI